jgi:rhodanese-related sulfurtransferase
MAMTVSDPAMLETVSVFEAHAEQKAGKAILIDVRRPDEWESTGVPAGAELLTMQDPAFLSRIEALSGGDKTRRILFTCRTGARSGNVQQALHDIGYTDVVNVRGGFVGNGIDLGWSQADLPVATYSGD